VLREAIEARLPVIAVTTRDTLNFAEALAEVMEGLPLQAMKWENPEAPPKPDHVYWKIIEVSKEHVDKGKSKLDALKIYRQMVAAEASLILVNLPTVEDAMFNAGEMPNPRKLIQSGLGSVLDDDDIPKGLALAEPMMGVLGGLTMKEAMEIAKLTMVRDNSLTAPGLMKTRRTFFQPQQGMTLIDSDQELYIPEPALLKYVQNEGKFFLGGDVDYRLRPRGLLFDGPPGTGKTAGAKYIAYEWGVPLYRVDVGTTQSKWVGESEGNMAAVFKRLDLEEPCVALFDEIEKVFTQDADYGTKRTMMSQLLWWLAEHQSKVFVVMTTNKVHTIPPELHRERRIDMTMVFNGVPYADTPEFCEQVLATFDAFPAANIEKAAKKVVEQVWKKAAITGDKPSAIPQAALSEGVFTYLKAELSKPAQLTLPSPKKG
jgi:hypothetical protein